MNPRIDEKNTRLPPRPRLSVFRHSDLPDDIVGFHAQQAVEKQLKSLCAWRRLEYPYTHDIAALIEVLEDDGTFDHKSDAVAFIVPVRRRQQLAT